MKVVIATDGSPSAVHAITEAARLMPLDRAQVTLVAVSDPSLRIGGNEDADQDLVRGRAVLAAAGVEAAAVMATGEPATEILATATRLGADLIVVGSTGRGAVGRMLLGSVSDQVVRGWPGATLVITPKG